MWDSLCESFSLVKFFHIGAGGVKEATLDYQGAPSVSVFALAIVVDQQ